MVMVNLAMQGSNVNNNRAQAIDLAIAANNQDIFILGGWYGPESNLPAIIETPSNRYEGKLPVKLFPHVVIVNGEQLFIIGRHTQEEERRVSDGIYEVRLTPPYTSKILTRSKSQIILVGPAYKYDHVTPSHIGVT